MPRLSAVLMLALILGAVPAAAAASTVELDPVTGRAVFVGGNGPNDVTMHIFGGPSPAPFPGPRVWFTDEAQEVSAGTGCVASVAVWCPTLHAEIGLDNGDDRYRGFSYGDLAVTAGTGADDIYANGNFTSVSGGSGPDQISVGSNGREAAYGDGGDDDIRSVGPYYTFYTTILTGGSGNDLVYGEARRHDRGELSGEAGKDYLIVRGGNTVIGGGGEDVILVLPSVFSFRGGDTLSGGDDPDTIVGGHNADTVSGGTGDDVIDVSGDAGHDDFQGPDTIECGFGDDTVYADADDVIADDCEHRLDGPMPTNKNVEAALARFDVAFGVTTAD